MPDITAMNFLQLAPFLAMLLLMSVLLLTNLVSRGEIRKQHLWISASGLALIALGTLLFMKTLTQPIPIWGGLLRMDLSALSMMVLISAGAAVTAAFAAEEPDLAAHGEFSILLVAATLGLSLMTAANDLIMLYLSMEMAAIPLYVLAGFLVYDKLSSEAGLKYLLYGAVASAVMVYGFSWLFGISGSTAFTDISLALQNNAPILPLLVAAILILVGFGYKIAAVPFHFWAPDVYHGAPAPISGFLATASKTAGFVVLLRFLPLLWPNLQGTLQWILAGMAVLSMLAGNLLAMQQTNIKRMLAYSSIAHAGYLLIGVAAGTAESTTGIYYYLSGYLFTNLVAFALAALAARQTGSEEISSFCRTQPAQSRIGADVPDRLPLAGRNSTLRRICRKSVRLSGCCPCRSFLVGRHRVCLTPCWRLFYYLNVLKVIYARPASEEQVTEVDPVIHRS